MKKLLIVLLALTVVGIFAFADDAAPASAPVVTISDWGRQVFAFGNQDGDGYWMGVGSSWGANPRIVGLNIQAHTENVGFSITPCADNGTFGLTDQNKAWVSPIPGLTFESGLNLETDTWRGSMGMGSDDWLRYPGVAVAGNSSTFARLGEGGFMSDVNYNKDGIGVWVAAQNGKTSSKPITATLTVGGIEYTATSDTETGGGDSQAATSIKAAQIGAAYAVPNVATIKVQYLGKDVSGIGFMGNPGTSGIINAAINVGAVKGLYEEIGIIYPIDTDVGYTFAFADDLSYTFAPVTIRARVQGVNYDDTTGLTKGLALAGGIGIDYDAGNSVGVSADVQYVSKDQEVNSGKAGDALTGGGVFIKKGFSNGYIGIGAQYSTIGWAGGNSVGVTNEEAHWAIPIVLQESF
jgi:hypothetical protein